MRQFLGVGLLALIAALAGYFGARWIGGPNAPPPRPAPVATGGIEAGDRRPAFELPGLDGQTHAIGEWDGKLILLNFWATWCGPCREEMPMLNQLQAEHGDQGLQVIGVALDLPVPVQSFVAQLGIDYPILIDDMTGVTVMQRYGNHRGVLPYSVLIDRDGRIVETMLGMLHRNRIEETLRDYL